MVAGIGAGLDPEASAWADRVKADALPGFAETGEAAGRAEPASPA
jgi:hypothetical protein